MRLPIYQVDAFADRVFGGNPAAVVPLEQWLPDDLLQSIAAENNLSETAFFVPLEPGRWDLRWFTPTAEVDLCGHATLATAHVITTQLSPGLGRMVFATRKAGDLVVTREGELLTLDFPSRPPRPATPDPLLVQGLGGPVPQAVLTARDWLVVYGSARQVLDLTPDIATLGRLDRMVIVTAAGDPSVGEGVDFVSRFFAPGHGIAEDPVTGSAHCTLVPYWAGVLGRTDLLARQVSRRGGTLVCGLRGDRVRIGGRAIPYLEGFIRL